MHILYLEIRKFAYEFDAWCKKTIVRDNIKVLVERKKESEVTQLCPTLCDPMDCSLPGSSVHGIFQAIVLEWIDISFSRRSSQPRAQTRVSHTVDRHFIVWATRSSFTKWRVTGKQILNFA